MAVGAVVARILTQYSDKGSKAAQKDIAKLGKKFDDFGKKSAKAFGLVAAASAAMAIKIGKDAVQAAISDQKSQTLLANSLRNTVDATDSAIASVESHITSLQKQFSVVDDDLRPSMAKLAAATGSVTTATNLLDTALNVSASSGADLATATDAIAKASAGQFKALKKLVPGLSLTTMKAKDFGKAIAQVNKETAGAAAARANTLEYRLIGLKIQFGEILETLGYALLPVIQKFATIIQTKVLPQLEAWVALNKDKLADGLQKAAEFALQLAINMAVFGKWVADNFEMIKNLAILLTSMWAVGKVLAFANAVGKVSLAMKGLAGASAVAGSTGLLGALGLGAAGAGAAALAVPAAVVAALLGITYGLSKIAPSGDPFAKPKEYVAGKNPIQSGTYLSGGGVTAQSNAVLEDYLAIQKAIDAANKKTTASSKKALTAQQKEYNLKLKMLGITTTDQQDAITQFAIYKNLIKQKALGLTQTAIDANSTSVSSVATSAEMQKAALIEKIRALNFKIRDTINAINISLGIARIPAGTSPSFSSGFGLGGSSTDSASNALQSFRNAESQSIIVNNNINGSLVAQDDLISVIIDGIERTVRRNSGLSYGR